jgi:hypothetical protein
MTSPSVPSIIVPVLKALYIMMATLVISSVAIGGNHPRLSIPAKQSAAKKIVEIDSDRLEVDESQAERAERLPSFSLLCLFILSTLNPINKVSIPAVAANRENDPSSPSIPICLLDLPPPAMS